ncbi:hypothetical protein, partial [Paenibacillus koleovorans]|uniref:hypothetical protein n=1 Tax=Paenibacillus koleovorans TaxID=121608 RepID=UPI0013E36204
MDTEPKSILVEKFNKLRSLALPQQSHGRLAETAAWLQLGLESALEYAISIQAIDERAKQQWIEAGWNCFMSLSGIQSELVSDVKPVRRFLSVVQELLANQSIYTKAINKGEYGEVQHHGELVGWHDSEHYYFLHDTVYRVVYQFLQGQGEHFPVSAKILWKQMDAEGVILSGEELEKGQIRKRHVIKKTIEGNRIGVIAVRSFFVQPSASNEISNHSVRNRTHSLTPAENLFAPKPGSAPP